MADIENENNNISDDTDSNDEDSPPRIKKQKSSTFRRGLASLMSQCKDSDDDDDDDDNDDNEDDNDKKRIDNQSQYNIYSNKVANCLGDVKKKSYVLDLSVDDEIDEDEDLIDVPICHNNDFQSDVITVGDERERTDLEDSQISNCSLLDELSPQPVVNVPKPTRKLQSALNTLNRARSLVESDDLNNSLILDHTDVAYTGTVSPVKQKDDIILKVLHKGKAYKMNIKRSDPFYKVSEHLADQLDVLSSEIMLILGDRTISNTDTPNRIKLQLTDIIDCHILDSNSQSSNNSLIDCPVANAITICVQSHSRNSKVDITVDKTAPLQNVLEKYAADRKVDISTLTFRFDGDEVNPSETPEDLDMDDNDCIDAIEKEAPPVIVVDESPVVTKLKPANKRRTRKTRRR